MLCFVVLRKYYVSVVLISLLLGGLWFSRSTISPQSIRSWVSHDSAHDIDLHQYDEILTRARNITAQPPPLSAFGERGALTELLANWTDRIITQGSGLDGERNVEISEALEGAFTALYPFLSHPKRAYDKTPFASLMDRQTPGSRGIVISVGKDQFRYAAHLIANLRDVLGSKLPIEVAYAGDDDLPEEYRVQLRSLASDIYFLDVLSVFSDETLQLRQGNWAVKPFALLASRFEQTILMDADSVFLQKPEELFDSHQGYRSTGILLFHDRLLWQNVFKERAKWWHEEMRGRQPSAALLKSKVWMEGYAEEGDSGVVVMDKSSTLAMAGLLHVAWQNSKEVRDKWTYRITYGDKESWWFGFELSGVPFAFEEHYGAVLGEMRQEGDAAKVCGFSIAHLDERQRLIWFNGSLLKNKIANATEYWSPEYWMVDGKWLKGATKADLSCMVNMEPQDVPPEIRSVLDKSVDKARQLDQQFEHLI